MDFFVDRIAAWQGDRAASSIRILDVGCGNGNIALPFAALGYHVTGVDLDAAAIQRATEASSRVSQSVRWLHGSVQLVAGETFDVIIASEVIEHLAQPVEFLQSLRRLCAPDGLLLASVPNGKSVEERIRRLTTYTRIGCSVKRHVKRVIGHEDVQSSACSPHKQFFSWTALVDALYAGGWKVSSDAAAAAWFKELFYLGGRVILRRGSRIFHLLDALDAAMASWTPRACADGWMLEARPFDPTKPLVVQVVTTLAAGGAERIVFELTRHLPEYGFDAHAVVLMGGGPLKTIFDNAGVPVTVFERRGPFGAWAFFPLKDFYARQRPAIVHTHLFGADVWGRLAAWLERVPVIISTEHNLHRDRGWFKRCVAALLARVTTAFVAVSSDVKRYMVSPQGISARKVHLIRNGIDLSHILPRPIEPFHSVPRFITIGRLAAQKDHATLLRALTLVKRPWRLDLVGSGELEKDLKQLAKGLGISQQICWLEYREDVAQLLSQSDLFCFPSRWEGLGLAFIEAAAAGVPILASDLPAFHEILSAKDATYVPAGDVSAWAAAIERILTDPSEYISRAHRVMQKISQRYDVVRMVKKHATLYADLYAHSSRQ